MKLPRAIGCILLGHLVGICVALWLDVPGDMGWLAGLICAAFSVSFVLILWKDKEGVS